MVSTPVCGTANLEALLKSKRPTYAKETFQLYLQATFVHRKQALLSLLTPLGTMLTNVGVPFYAGQALASIATHNGQFAAKMIVLAVLAGLGILANRIGFTNLMELQATTMSDLNTKVFNRLIERSVGFHTNQISGKLISDALDFVSSYSSLLMAAYNTGVSFAGVLISGLIVVSFSSWQLGLFLAVVVSITLIWAYTESRTRGDLRSVRLIATKDVTAHFSDTIVNA